MKNRGIGIFGGAVFFLSILLVLPAWGMEVIKLGFTGSLSGGSAKYGRNSEAGLLMAMEEINGKGGIAVAGKIYGVNHFRFGTKAERDSSFL